MNKSYTKIFDEIKRQIVYITDDDVFIMGKDFMRIKIETNDVLPYNKQIDFPVCVISIRSIFEENGVYYHYMIALMIMKTNCAFSFVNLLNSLVM